MLFLYSRALVNDIAVVTLSGSDIEFSNTLRPACLPYDYRGFDFESLRNDPTVIGWGATSTSGGVSNVLRQVIKLSRFVVLAF